MPDDGGVPIPKAYLERAGRPGAVATVRERLPEKLEQIAGDGRLVSLLILIGIRIGLGLRG